MEEVRSLHGQRFLKQLLSNYKVSILEEKKDVQVEQFYYYLAEKRIQSFFEHLRSST